jgi:hypothetical protein
MVMNPLFIMVRHMQYGRMKTSTLLNGVWRTLISIGVISEEDLVIVKRSLEELVKLSLSVR